MLAYRTAGRDARENSSGGRDGHPSDGQTIRSGLPELSFEGAEEVLPAGQTNPSAWSKLSFGPAKILSLKQKNNHPSNNQRLAQSAPKLAIFAQKTAAHEKTRLYTTPLSTSSATARNCTEKTKTTPPRAKTTRPSRCNSNKICKFATETHRAADTAHRTKDKEHSPRNTINRDLQR